MTQQTDKGIIVDILDKLFTDATSGEIVFYRAILLVLLFLLVFVWVSREDLFELYKQTTFDSYQETISSERSRKFDLIAQEQLQIIHITSNDSFSMITSFRPKNLNYFADIVAIEGRPPPEFVGKESLGGFPINKTSNEYLTHLSGLPYITKDQFPYIKDKDNNFNYMFSCPYFNLDNVYSGSVYMFWQDKPDLPYDSIYTLCYQTSRVLGRIK